MIVLKAIAGRSRDRQDVEEILDFQRTRIDKGLVRKDIAEVLPDGHPNRVWLEETLSRLG